ncbi:MAG: peptidoglycan DD-metalloendopeptidase family protein [Actinomycetota bacterium]|nr:peptidoglycan DD-metalloendopeptidase family protein [Euzebyales bacterium]MDQ3342354.1 peptidoglycan DD-metalloendopeptidase family protein [Actinomycetota bacterium]MDQ3529886.1 peptidoglycan DD-metalloendopeptidase family protein [Actinomycetota bacterium]
MQRFTASLFAALALVVAWLPVGPAGSAPAAWAFAAVGQSRSSTAGVPPVRGPVLRTFDPPASRYGAGHRGVDLAAAPGEPVRAALDGSVSFSGTVVRVGWVTLDHGGGLSTTYGPLDPRSVRASDRVKSGQRLGRVADGALHLDWGARVGDTYIDPLSLLGRWQVHLTSPDSMVTKLPARWVTSPQAVGRGPGALDTGVAGSGQQWHLVAPIAGPVTSPFGTRAHPITGEVRAHAGIDFGAPSGIPVAAAGGGTITFAGAAGGYGLLVIVDHGGGLTTRYAHLSSLAAGAGQRVATGQAIGAVGSTGLSTGPHLHFEVRFDGVAQDPVRWLGRPTG